MPHNLRHLDPQRRITISKKALEQIGFNPENDIFQISVINQNEIRLIRRPIGRENSQE